MAEKSKSNDIRNKGVTEAEGPEVTEESNSVDIREGVSKGGQKEIRTGDEISDLRWKVGWNPILVIPGVTVALTLLGGAAGIPATMLFLGIFVGGGVWYWGVMEINDKYKLVRDQFFDEVVRNAAIDIDLENAESFSLNWADEDSLPLVEPPKNYHSTGIIVADTSVNINKGAQLDMEKRTVVQGGTNLEFFYDQITSIKSEESGPKTHLEISSAGMEAERIGPSKQNSVNEALRAIRNKTRETRR